MAFERPSLSKLVRRAKSDISTRLPGADANLRGTPEEVLAIALAGMTHGLHGHLKWLSKQVLPDLADDEFLIRMAAIRDLEPTPADFAAGAATITGTESTVCPAGTVWESGSGALYTQDADVTIVSGSATIALTAEVAGEDGNADVGTKLELAAPVAGINSSATVSGGGITDGVDVETTEALRTRLLALIRNPPKGGGPGDYANWALEVSGVTRAWEYPLQLGLGTVVVTFVMDTQALTIIPDAAKILAVQTHLEATIPVTSEVTVVAPTELTLNPNIHLTPDTSPVRAAVEAELLDLLARRAEPGDTDGRGTILLSQINEAISIATGETDHVLVSPVANVVPDVLELVTLGTITWS